MRLTVNEAAERIRAAAGSRIDGLEDILAELVASPKPGYAGRGQALGGAAEQLWHRVDKSAGPDGCWLWTGYRSATGYGQIIVCPEYKRFSSHRLAWTVTHGDIPAGLYVLHSCDNPPCCNPAHLRLGTKADNSADAVRRGRIASGDRHGSRLHPERRARGQRNAAAKLTELQVVEIKGLLADKTLGHAGIARRYGVVPGVVTAIANGLTWKWVGRAESPTVLPPLPDAPPRQSSTVTRRRFVRPPEERFWPRVDKNGPEHETLGRCWIWRGSLDRAGYGICSVGSFKRAHRFAWVATNGPIPDGHVVMHECDVRACCNPSHLKTGTQAENQGDMVRRGRSARGQRAAIHQHPDKYRHRLKLSVEQVREIRELLRTNQMRPSQIAQKYGVTQANVSAIQTGRSWAWLE